MPNETLLKGVSLLRKMMALESASLAKLPTCRATDCRDCRSLQISWQMVFGLILLVGC